MAISNSNSLKSVLQSGVYQSVRAMSSKGHLAKDLGVVSKFFDCVLRLMDKGKVEKALVDVFHNARKEKAIMQDLHQPENIKAIECAKLISERIRLQAILRSKLGAEHGSAAFHAVRELSQQWAAKMVANIQPPQSYFLNQPASGPEQNYSDSAFYALKNLTANLESGRRLTIDACRAESDINYLLFSDVGREELEAHTTKNGLLLERSFFEDFGIQDCERDQAIGAGRFMCVFTSETEISNGGHWLTFIKDTAGKWWEYNSLEENPRIVGKNGNESELQTLLNEKDAHSFKAESR